MPQLSLPTSVTNNQENDGENFAEEYQVDTISITSISQHSQEADDVDDDDEYVYNDNTIAVNDTPHLPHFGSVSVVNSNDVHFGNKTVYKGPVTIKQFVYPKSDGSNSSESGLGGLAKAIDGGVINGGFIGDQKNHDCEVAFKKDEFEEREQEANNNWTAFRKGFEWIKTVPYRRLKETILFVIILVISITTISAVVIWRNPSKVVQIDQKYPEEDNIVPIDYTSDTGALDKLRINNRLIWLAQPPAGSMNKLKLPVSLIIVHHTATISCTSQAQCVFQTRHIQTFHMESNGWSDIGYNFIIGGDGAVYEGRGWTLEGAHTLAWNNVSIGIAFIGTYNNEIPSSSMLSAFQLLVEKGVELGHVTKDYKVMGARQFSGTESPGKTFYELLKHWSHWIDFKDLKKVKL